MVFDFDVLVIRGLAVAAPLAASEASVGVEALAPGQVWASCSCLMDCSISLSLQPSIAEAAQRARSLASDSLEQEQVREIKLY